MNIHMRLTTYMMNRNALCSTLGVYPREAERAEEERPGEGGRGAAVRPRCGSLGRVDLVESPGARELMTLDENSYENGNVIDGLS